MAAGQKTITAMVMVLAMISAVHADMMPVGQLQAVKPQSPPVCEQTPAQPAGTEVAYTYGPITADLDLASVDPIHEANADAGQVRQTEPLQVLAHEPGSLNLCLYALIGLGLCRSAPWVKKLSFGIIPDWYYDGGPYQIGHSRAIGPDFLCRAVICCFIQPDDINEYLIPQHYLGKVASVLHKSLFVPGRLASRGPPVCV
jgi:hypothetical protein